MRDGQLPVRLASDISGAGPKAAGYRFAYHLGWSNPCNWGEIPEGRGHLSESEWTREIEVELGDAVRGGDRDAQARWLTTWFPECVEMLGRVSAEALGDFLDGIEKCDNEHGIIAWRKLSYGTGEPKALKKTDPPADIRAAYRQARHWHLNAKSDEDRHLSSKAWHEAEETLVSIIHDEMGWPEPGQALSLRIGDTLVVYAAGWMEYHSDADGPFLALLDIGDIKTTDTPRQATNHVYRRGFARGSEWAMSTATTLELETIAEEHRSLDWKSFHTEKPGDMASYIAGVINQHARIKRTKDFWSDNGYNHEEVGSNQWLKGFVDGAVKARSDIA